MAQERYRTGRQTAARPSAPKQKPVPSAAELQQRRKAAQERAKRAREEKIRLRRERRERRKRLFVLSFVVGVIFVALYWIWVVVDITGRPNGGEDALPILIYTAGEREKDSELEAETVYHNGSYYLPITSLEPYMAITQFGDWSTRSFLLCESGQWATFHLGTENAVINGQRVSLRYPAFCRDEVLYLPIDFFTDKMNCFTFDDSVALASKILTVHTEVTPSFAFCEDAVPQKVDAATIPVAPVFPSDEEPPQA